jgi:CRP-like cAMP-binding protein
MVGIPPALDSDTEDVVWALQTSEALWKRNERVDAIVWLRRAAQAAGEAEDDDRALALARDAAELADWVAHDRGSAAVPRSAPPALEAPTAGEAIDALLRTARADDTDEVATPDIDAATLAASPSTPPARAERVPSAAEVHAGMLDPWASDEGAAAEHPVPARRPAPPRLTMSVRKEASTALEEEVITSAPPVDRPAQRARSSRPASSSPRLPAATRKTGVDLSNVEALTDLPDDAREAFASVATITELAAEEEVSGFALAYVLDGSVDVTATIVDSPAQRLGAGAVLRSRGTIEQIAPVRLVAAPSRARVATWDEKAVAEAFRTCPWVEDELRAAGDRLQALVGVTMGPLGDRLDPGLRANVTSKLRLRALAEHEVFTLRGTPVPGLLVVGGGELELLGDDGMPNGAVVHPGEFLFAKEVLQGAPAPNTVRAAKGGALVLLAERGVAQELLVTCPPLLEIFAGM